MKNLKTAIIVLSILIIPLTLNARAEQSKDGEKRAFGVEAKYNSLYTELKISKEQKSKIDALHSQLSQAFSEYNKEMMTFREKERKLRFSEITTRREYNSVIDEMVFLRTRWQKARLDYYYAVKTILTPDQWDEFKDSFFDNVSLDLGFASRMSGQERGRGGGFGRPTIGQRMRNMEDLGIYALVRPSRVQSRAISNINEEKSDLREEYDEARAELIEEIEDAMSDDETPRAKVFEMVQKMENARGEKQKEEFTYDQRAIRVLDASQRSELLLKLQEMRSMGKR